MIERKFLLVGAGFANSVIARELAESGYKVTIIDKRPHLAGNCHTERDQLTNIMVHVYGPHIFHTNSQEVWDYVNRFGDFHPFINRVKTISNGKVYSLPINLHTINQFFNTICSPKEAQKLIEKKSDLSIVNPNSFEEQALRFMGRELYEAFFYGYTKKQWGIEPKELPASILKRLPIRFNYDDNYFSHKYQGIPKDGYTNIVKNILLHKNISILLNTAFDSSFKDDFEHIFWSAPLDAYFNFELGKLRYRTLDFEVFYGTGDYQGNAVINYGDEFVPFTRVSEHKHFSPWETHEKTICYKEFSRLCEGDDIPYYPIRLLKDKELLLKYIERAKKEKKVTFVGRLGTYRYLDMDVTIKESLELSKKVKVALSNNDKILPFYVDMSL
ncbi:UDP-galactopyranose mutase [Rodentibacter pneumotropicus]|uniref:UDP-galactopyranose mutase n=1 Tax=Rodentibacter pneumotropicus TaxID=758 RepID=A0AAW5LHT1_9PAST|nr:UDP-galactopyranose mutase [Rodentibacter pneumotropicus]MCQ9122357.1 UDP-galactopyranose mutase [Rodentibacter pneumotropicus]OOF67502.1 UDP-galactopyranose mutase [Rodentibacter pneumotropicus]